MLHGRQKRYNDIPRLGFDIGSMSILTIFDAAIKLSGTPCTNSSGTAAGMRERLWTKWSRVELIGTRNCGSVSL